MKKEFKAEQWEPLVDMLREEVQECGALLNLLSDQQNRILGRETDAMVSLNKDINEQVDYNYKLQSNRSEYVQELASEVGLSGESRTKALIPFMPKNVQELFCALVDELADLFLRSQSKAGQNQMLLVRSTEVIEQVIRMVQPEAATKTYDSKGAIRFGSTPNKSGSVETSV